MLRRLVRDFSLVLPFLLAFPLTSWLKAASEARYIDPSPLPGVGYFEFQRPFWAPGTVMYDFVLRAFVVWDGENFRELPWVEDKLDEHEDLQRVYPEGQKLAGSP